MIENNLRLKLMVYKKQCSKSSPKFSIHSITFHKIYKIAFLVALSIKFFSVNSRRSSCYILTFAYYNIFLD